MSSQIKINYEDDDNINNKPKFKKTFTTKSQFTSGNFPGKFSNTNSLNTEIEKTNQQK